MLEKNASSISNDINDSNKSQSEKDSEIMKMQESLIMMGFDLTMINKIISHFKIRNQNQAIDYLIKGENGMWNHPFIPQEVNNEVQRNRSGLLSSVINKINITDSRKEIINSANLMIKNGDELNESQMQADICEICGESKEFHKIKNIEIPKVKANKNGEKKKNILIDEEEDEKDVSNNNNINNGDGNMVYLNCEEDERENNICPICMSEFENPLEVENCKHKFCFECFHSYLVNLIDNNNIDQIPCPNKQCDNKNISEEFFQNYLMEEEYFKFRQFKAQNQIARDPKKMFCPICDSYAQIDEKAISKYRPDDPNYVKSTLKCMNGHEFCSCGRPLHENKCYKDEKEFKEMVKKEKIKKCPKCGFLIKKNMGCNHMTCGNPTCKYEFCWICMKEAIPDHYTLGPCQGKQFIDPDTFEYWLEENHKCLFYLYRTIVIFFLVIGIIISFVLIPGIGLCIFFYFLFYESNANIYFPSDMVRFFEFLICICLSFPIQSIIYNCFIIIYLISINYKYALIFFSSLLIIPLIIYIIGELINRCLNHHHHHLVDMDMDQRINFGLEAIDINEDNGENFNEQP